MFFIAILVVCEMYKDQRSRPRGRSRGDDTILESIVWIASEHDVGPRRLMNALFVAFQNQIAHCGDLKIMCRKVTPDAATFLITRGEKVIWQYPVKVETIQNPDVRDSIKQIPIPEKKIDESSKTLTISKLRYGMKGITITGKIVEIPPSRKVVTRWGYPALVSNVRIADETGSIRLSLWNEQIKMVNLGDEVEIRNCSVSRFAHEPQLRLSRSGILSVRNQLQEEELVQYSTVN